MATLNCLVAQSSDDWDDIDSTGTSITARAIRDPFGTPTAIESAFADITTSGIDSSWTINSAILHFNTEGCTIEPRGEYWQTIIYMHNGSDFVNIDESAADRPNGWDSITLTATEIGYINRSGKTSFKFWVPLSSTWGSTHYWSILSYDTAQASAVYLEIDYTVPSTLRRRVIIIG